jgi:hypothetical protein
VDEFENLALRWLLRCLQEHRVPSSEYLQRGAELLPRLQISVQGQHRDSHILQAQGFRQRSLPLVLQVYSTTRSIAKPTLASRQVRQGHRRSMEPREYT